MKSIKKILAVTVLFVGSIAFTEVPPDDGESGARYCRCKKNTNQWGYEFMDCLAGNAFSFRPICVEGGGDCTTGASNCNS